MNEKLGGGSRQVASDQDIIKGIQQPGRFDALATSEDHARELLQQAFPDGVELPAAVSGTPYPKPPPGVKKWFQLHPPEPAVGHNRPHFKYEDWTQGKKRSGGSWGHIEF
jgi:hypothetical protein